MRVFSNFKKIFLFFIILTLCFVTTCRKELGKGGGPEISDGPPNDPPPNSVKVYVNNTTGSSANSGMSAGDAVDSIDQGVQIASSYYTSNGSTEIVYVVVATGSYGENVTLRTGVSIMGGYTLDFDMDARDKNANPTTITGAGDYAVENASGAVLDSYNVIDGFTINGSLNGTSSRAINLDGAVIRVRNNTINGGVGDESVCIQVDNTGEDIYIENNIIRADNANTTNSFGIYLCSNFTGLAYIENNSEITAGNSVTGSAIYLATGGANLITIADNGTIKGGGAALNDCNNSYGIYLGASAVAEISGNTTVTGGFGTTESYGIYKTGANTINILNNNEINGGQTEAGTCSGILIAGTAMANIIDNTLIYGGVADDFVYAINIKTSASLLIQGNTIDGGIDCSNAKAVGIYIDNDTTRPIIGSRSTDNDPADGNTIICHDMATVGIYEALVVAQAGIVKNNIFQRNSDPTVTYFRVAGFAYANLDFEGEPWPNADSINNQITP